MWLSRRNVTRFVDRHPRAESPQEVDEDEQELERRLESSFAESEIVHHKGSANFSDVDSEEGVSSFFLSF